MSLRRKLLTTFGALATLALVIAAMTLWVIAQWRTSNEQLAGHYARSLLVQDVRARTIRAFKEVADAVSGDDDDARQEFAELLRPAEQDFQRWAELADTDEERVEVQQVRGAYDQLGRTAQRVFDLVDAGRDAEAFALLEGPLEDDDLRRFQEVTEQAIAADRGKREVIRARIENTRRTAQVVLTIAGFGTLSLILLLAAYLASDLFAPLRALQGAMEDVVRGERHRRLDDERQDELGALNRTFNRLVQAVSRREQMAGLAAMPASDGGADGEGEADGDGAGRSWRDTPSRLILHTLVSQVRARVGQLHQADGADGDGAGTAEQRRALIDELDQLSLTVARVTEFGLPLDLNLSRTNIRALLYEVLLRFHDDLVRRGISFEIQIAPDAGWATVDRLKLREALGELVRNALAALPERGGRLGLRASLTAEGTELLIEVADNGSGAETLLVERALTTVATGGERIRVGLTLTKAVVEQHGGQLAIDSKPGEGTYVQVRLPLHE